MVPAGFFSRGLKSLWPAETVCREGARTQPGNLLPTGFEPAELAEGLLGVWGGTWLLHAAFPGSISQKPKHIQTSAHHGADAFDHVAQTAVYKCTPMHVHVLAPSAPTPGMPLASHAAGGRGLWSDRAAEQV